jgi:hypothetical protein
VGGLCFGENGMGRSLQLGCLRLTS